MRTNVLFSFFFCFLCNTNKVDAAFYGMKGKPNRRHGMKCMDYEHGF